MPTAFWTAICLLIRIKKSKYNKMKLHKISSLLLAFSLFLSINALAQSPIECSGKYDCWVAKAHDALKKKKFVDAAYRFAAAQACDDAPIPDTLSKWIDQTYQDNIAFIENQEKENVTRIKDAENQEIANSITEDFAHIMQYKDVTMQALLLHLACRKTQNTNKLAMRSRREIMSNPENHFYKRAQPVNTEGGQKAVVSKDGSMVLLLTQNTIAHNARLKIFDKTLPPILNQKLSPNDKYLFIQTVDKNSVMRGVYIAAKSLNPKNSFCIIKTEDFSMMQEINTTDGIAAFAFSQSSDSVVYIHNDGRIMVQNLKEKTTTQSGQIKLEQFDTITNLIMTHAGQKLLVGYANGRINQCNMKGKILTTFPSFHTRNINAWDVSKDDKYLLTGGLDSTAVVWSMHRRPVMLDHTRYKDIVTSVAFSPDDSFNITSSLDKSVRIKDMEGNTVIEAKGHEKGVIAAGFAAHGHTFFSLDSDNLKTWEFKTQNYDVAPLSAWKDHYPAILKGNMHYSPNKMFKIWTNTEGVSSVANNKGTIIFTFESITQSVFSPDDKFILIVRNDTAYAYDLKSKDLMWALKSKYKISNAFFAPVPNDHFLMLEDADNQRAELWNLKNSINAPLNTFKENFGNPAFLGNGSVLVNNNGSISVTNNNAKTEFRKPQEPRTPFATLDNHAVTLFFDDKTTTLYAVHLAEVEAENKQMEHKYALFEINTGDITKNKNLQPSYTFDVPISDGLRTDFTDNGDTVLFKTPKGVFVYPNVIKLLNEKRYLPHVLTNKAKRENGILTVDDCTKEGQLKDKVECALFYAESVVKNKSFINQFEEVYESMNPSVSKGNLEANDSIVWSDFHFKLIDIVANYPYESFFKEKIKLTKIVIDIKERILDEEIPEDLGAQYSNLCWYILFDESPDKFQKSLEYGQKALELNQADWIYANLGHAYLFNNQFEEAVKHYAYLLERIDDLYKDMDILEKMDITHPRMNEARRKLDEMVNKPRKY